MILPLPAVAPEPSVTIPCLRCSWLCCRKALISCLVVYVLLFVNVFLRRPCSHPRVCSYFPSACSLDGICLPVRALALVAINCTLFLARIAVHVHMDCACVSLAAVSVSGEPSCECFVGYQGESCSECFPGFAPFQTSKGSVCNALPLNPPRRVRGCFCCCCCTATASVRSFVVVWCA